MGVNGFYFISAEVGIFTLIFYKEPPRDAEAESQRSLGEVFAGMIAVVGNGRFFLLIVGLMLLFLFRYRRRPGHEVQSKVSHSTALEITWSVIKKGSQEWSGSITYLNVYTYILSQGNYSCS